MLIEPIFYFVAVTVVISNFVTYPTAFLSFSLNNGIAGLCFKKS